MFKHILLPVDGSSTASLAVTKALSMAKAFGSKVTALYVLDPYPFASAGPDFAFGQAQYLSAVNTEAEQALKEVANAFAAEGVTVDTVTVDAYAVWKGIIDTSDEVGADVIVMGSHGRRGVEKLMLGSGAQRVVSHAHNSVLIVHHGAGGKAE